MNAIILYCPKCQSRDVSKTRMTPLPEPEMVSMDDLGTSRVFGRLVLHLATWRATCNQCGYYVEYQEQV